MANQLSRTDSSSNQDIRQRFNVKKTIIGVIVLLIGLCHLPEAILLIMDGISLDSILYFSNNINIEKGTGGNLRLDVLMSADKKFAAVRLLQFIPYSYIPVMDMQYLRNDKIAALENFLEHSK